MMIIRRIRRLSGSPRLRLLIRPASDYGSQRPAVTCGSHHIRYVAADFVMRITTDASITAILEETPFYLEDTLTLMLGPDETVPDAVSEVSDRFQRETIAYWQRWVRYLNIPFELAGSGDSRCDNAQTQYLRRQWGDYCSNDYIYSRGFQADGRNWDYRYCWLRDGYFVVNTLNRLGVTRMMESFLRLYC